MNEWQCNRGIPIYIRMNAKTSELFCLCPPSYYGDQCQFQNQRASLTLQVRTTSDWRSVFIFILSLTDDQGNIESHDYIEYLSVRDCQIKFNVYLLYSTRPKNASKSYSVRIDAFNKLTSDYRASWLFPLRFSFLPVHRLSVLLTVPNSNSEPNPRCIPSCIHGQCFNYVNDSNSTFCRCFSDWSGIQCNRKHACNCAPDSMCIGGSVCVCSSGKFGSRCYLRQSMCNSKTCANGGQCIPGDERYTPSHHDRPTCICPEGYSGDHCENKQSIRIDVLFHNILSVPPSLLVHLITVQNQAEHTRTSIMKKIAFDQNSVSFYTSISFNVAFAEMYRDYYLIVLREQLIVSVTIFVEIIPSHRCISIKELFNESIISIRFWKLMKLYHIPCGERHELVCFYDSIHICLCNGARQANCMKFVRNMTHDCQGRNLCKNGGECFQDNFQCPTSSTCACLDCYYGSRCQFSTRGSALSLDAIMGYTIRPDTGINQQSNVVKVAIVLTTIIYGLGILSNLLTFTTFQSKKTRDVGCGLYLSTSSIISFITLSMLTLKFWILLASQTGWIKNRSLMYVQCLTIDYLLRVLVSSGDWLSSCVAIERAVNVTKGVYFDKAGSQRIAKWIIMIVFVSTTFTHLHDPIHRQLIDDEEEQRTWCVTNYSPFLQIFDRSLNVIHFSIPVSINCISALLIIINAARARSIVQRTHTYNQVLREQLAHHKHLLISPTILVLLALPRLIISFLFGCMKSARNPWFYLIGYYIAFIPPMLLFFIFVLPSKTYKKEFMESIRRFRLC